MKSRDPLDVAFDVLLSQFGPVKRAAVIEQVELALEQNRKGLPITAGQRLRLPDEVEDDEL